MKIYDCKCEECGAEFQAVMENTDEELNCPSCNSSKIKLTETEFTLGCGGGCSSCSSGCGTEEK